MTKKDEDGEDEKDTKAEETLQSSDEKWEQLLAKPEAKRVMRDMAREALEDYRAGRTTRPSMKSQATPKFWKLYARLPGSIQQRARKAYQLWKVICALRKKPY